ncbi:hypothetical protein B0H10DRAFT_1940989 [Mycena sp. CBHHK59/15]|nr:hypothetical protein B0H10DRAFT_1940989 [Mycena sp. CBHHK59/15]
MALVYLAMDVRGYDPSEERWTTAEAWGNTCPTLEACSLNGDVFKKVDGIWVGCSKLEFEAWAGISEFEAIYTDPSLRRNHQEELEKPSLPRSDSGRSPRHSDHRNQRPDKGEEREKKVKKAGK